MSKKYEGKLEKIKQIGQPSNIRLLELNLDYLK